MVWRFFLYLSVAEARCHRGYLFVDSRDIFWQRNLFALTPSSWWSDAVVLTLEGRRQLSTSGAVVDEHQNTLEDRKRDKFMRHGKFLSCYSKVWSLRNRL